MGENLIKTIQTDDKNNGILPEKLEVQWLGIKYLFSKSSLLLFSFGMPILGILIFLFLNMSFNSWITEMFIKQVSYIMGLIFDVESIVSINPNIITIHLPIPSVTGRVLTVCYGAEVISIFIGIVLSTPSSQNLKPKLNIMWRKTMLSILIILSTYFSHMVRMILMLASVHYGMPMHITHDSSYYLITLISVVIILYFLRKILPEFFVSLNYIRYSISTTKINNPLTDKIKTKKKSKELTVKRKEIYYPLVAITVCTSILYFIVLFLLSYRDNINIYEITLPLLFALVLLIGRPLLGMLKNLPHFDYKLPILSFILIVCSFFFFSNLAYFLTRGILNYITVVIYITSVIFIYYFFHKEVKNYVLIEKV